MLAAFTYRDFRVQWFGACTSSIGTWTQTAAQNWMVLSLTGSGFFLGLDAFLQQLPIMLFTLIGGVLADRHDRRRTLLTSQYIQMATAATLGVLVILHVVEIWHILALSFCTGVAQAFGGPAYQSLIPSLVDKKICRTPSRSTRFSSTSRACSARSPSAPRWRSARSGDSTSRRRWRLLPDQRAVVSGRDLRADVAAPEAHPATTTTRMLDELRGGLSYVRHHGSLVGLIVLAATTTFLGFCGADVPAAVHAARLSRRARRPTATCWRFRASARLSARSSWRGSANFRGWG